MIILFLVAMEPSYRLMRAPGLFLCQLILLALRGSNADHIEGYTPIRMNVRAIESRLRISRQPQFISAAA
jgi:hypothetical protein